MEEYQPTAPHTQPMPTPQEQHVGFPAPRGEEKKSGLLKWIIASVGVIAIIIVGAIFVLRPPAETETEPTPQGNVLTAVATPIETSTPEPVATPTPEPVAKSEIAIQIQNGTGTPGDASLVQTALKTAGFSEIEAENADSQDETETTLTYSASVPQPVVDEVEAVLKKLFDDVRTRRGTVGDDFDIRILTGPKSTTAKAAATATATATATPTPEPTSDN